MSRRPPRPLAHRQFRTFDLARPTHDQLASQGVKDRSVSGVLARRVREQCKRCVGGAPLSASKAVRGIGKPCGSSKREDPRGCDLRKLSRCRDGGIRTHDPLTPSLITIALMEIASCCRVQQPAHIGVSRRVLAFAGGTRSMEGGSPLLPRPLPRPIKSFGCQPVHAVSRRRAFRRRRCGFADGWDDRVTSLRRRWRRSPPPSSPGRNRPRVLWARPC